MKSIEYKLKFKDAAPGEAPGSWTKARLKFTVIGDRYKVRHFLEAIERCFNEIGIMFQEREKDGAKNSK